MNIFSRINHTWSLTDHWLLNLLWHCEFLKHVCRCRRVPFVRLKIYGICQVDVVLCLLSLKCVCFPCKYSASSARLGSNAWFSRESKSSSSPLLLNPQLLFCLLFQLRLVNALLLFSRFLRSYKLCKYDLNPQFA